MLTREAKLREAKANISALLGVFTPEEWKEFSTQVIYTCTFRAPSPDCVIPPTIVYSSGDWSRGEPYANNIRATFGTKGLVND